ncbi:hypothetical protein UlMin_029639 [Ulmus minor]
MAQEIVSSVLQTLTQPIIEEAKFLSGVKDKVEDAKLELRMMRCFLKDADAKARGGDKILRDWVLEITDVAYDLENVVATFVLKEEAAARKGMVMRFACLFKRASELHKVGSKIDILSNRISKLTQGMQTYGLKVIPSNDRQNDSRRTYSHVPDHDFVGFGKNIKELVEHLTDPASGVVSICGMGGLGKTTLAKEVSHRSEKVKNHFNSFPWKYVSQQFQPKEILEGILFDLPSPPERREIKDMSYDGVVTKLYRVLQQQKCLVVLDDVWSKAAWDILKPAFPENTKILITTRIKDVAEHAKQERGGFVCEPETLTEEESWELLEKKASYLQSIQATNYEKMKKLGKDMLKHCGGLPLAVVVLGGLLSEKQTLDEWATLHQNVKELITKGKSIGEQEGVLGVLGLSYDELPYQLKPCFLHLANFPEDSEINVKELCRLWTAEGFVLNENEAHKCLMALVQVGKRSSIVGRIKTCRMHDLMRDLSLEKARNENFLSFINFQEAKGSGVSTQVMPTGKVRRLAVHSNMNIVSELLPLTNNRDGCLRSLIFFSPYQDLPNPRDLFKSLFKSFYMLRVLKFENISTFRNVYLKEIGRLIHLRFLSLPGCRMNFRLPSSMANLRCLQTLNLRALSIMSIMLLRSMNIVISKLDHLRHLYLPVRKRKARSLQQLCVQSVKSFQLRLGNLKSLETLVNFDTRYCKLDDLSQLTKLTKLRIITQKGSREIKPTSNLQSLALFGLYPFEYTLIKLEDIVPSLSSYLRIQKLTLQKKLASLQENILPPNLVKVTLEYNLLEIDPMLILGKLSKLRILHLRYLSYVGKKMVCCKDSFPQLESLSIQGLENLEEWRVEEGGEGTALHQRCVQYSVKSFQLRLGNLKSLETLVNFDTRYCKLDDLSQLTKLTKLSVMTPKGSREIIPASNLQSLAFFRLYPSENALKLQDMVPSLSSYLRIQKLNLLGELVSLEENILPPNLVKVTLGFTLLEIDPMLILGKLSKLRILHLDYDSYKGKKMVCCKDSFPQLESLSIQTLRNLEEWTVEEGALSKLCHLKIQDCEKLKSYPHGLKNITTLK